MRKHSYLASLVVVLLALPVVAQGQQAPDLDVFNLTVPSPVGAGWFVMMDADVRNVGECHIDLRDQNDAVEYPVNVSAGAYAIELRVRSSGGFATAGLTIDGIPFGEITTTASSFETRLSAAAALATGSHTLELRYVLGAGRLYVDSIRVLTSPGGVQVAAFEAEVYTAGGSTVDAIHPSRTKVTFYRGDPDAGGIQIGDAQDVGSTRQTEGGWVHFLYNNQQVAAEERWIAGPLGTQQIYAKITSTPSDPPDANSANDKRSVTVEVIELPIPTLTEVGTLVLALLLAGLTVYWLRRRAREAPLAS